MKILLRRGVALAMSGSLLLGGFPAAGDGVPSTPMLTWAATTHNKVGDGTYQLLDGTAITGIMARGIDTSHWQGAIDWNQAAQDDVSFVMLGTRYKGAVDPMFHTNATNAAAAGIKLGAYIYSYATDVAGAEAEADFILDLIKDYPISYPVAFDIEDSSQTSLSPTEISNIINAFCRKIEAAGYHPMVYANDYWLANKIDLSQIDYDVWVARYEVKHTFENPVMWQATSTGRVNGINGNVDINFQYKDFSADTPANLWRTIGGSTYYYQNYTMQKNTWIDDGTGWFYMNGDGQAATGWMTQNGSTYYLDANSGRMAQGWLQTGEGWRYLGDNGAMQTGWIQDNGASYHLNGQGLMDTGWIQDSGKWYFLGDSGVMATGWRQIGNVWYYFNESGVMLTGSQQLGDAWYYFDGSGAMLTGKQQIGGNWYYYDASGAMATGWEQIEGSWYYFNGSGVMQTGWVGDEQTRYYLEPSTGIMAVDVEITVDGVTYQVDASGVCRPAASENTGAGTTNSDSDSNTSSEETNTGDGSSAAATETNTNAGSNNSNVTTILPFGN